MPTQSPSIPQSCQDLKTDSVRSAPRQSVADLDRLFGNYRSCNDLGENKEKLGEVLDALKRAGVHVCNGGEVVC